MRLSALFEEFSQYLKVERGASHRSIDTYRRYFGYFMNFAKEQVGGSVLIAHFTPELCRSYQYFMASKDLQPGSVRVRLAVLGSFAKWAVKHSRLEKNPMEVITLPAKKSRVPGVPKWEAVEEFFTRCARHRDKAMLALMVYGGLRRSEVARLNVGDYQPQFGLRRVLGKGGHETTVPLPEVARAIVTEYLAKERSGAAASEPLFLVQYKSSSRADLGGRRSSNASRAPAVGYSVSRPCTERFGAASAMELEPPTSTHSQFNRSKTTTRIIPFGI